MRRNRKWLASGLAVAGCVAILGVATGNVVGFIRYAHNSDPYPYSAAQLQHAVGVIGAPPGYTLNGASAITASGGTTPEVDAVYVGSGSASSGTLWMASRLHALGLSSIPYAPGSTAGACGKFQFVATFGSTGASVRAITGVGVPDNPTPCPPGLP